MTTVTDEMLLDRIRSEADAAGNKSAELHRKGYNRRALLLDTAERFWLDLGFAVAIEAPLTDKQAFVCNFIRKDMSGDPRLWNRVTARGKRGRQVAA